MNEVNAQPLPTDVAAPEKPETTDAATKKRWTEFRQSIEICKNYRKKLVRNWTLNVDYRRGKPFSSQSDDDTIAVNLDWGFTKTKQAALFSQIPQVRVTHSPESLDVPWLAAYERKVNDTLITAGIESTMDEVLPDCINAAGFGAALVAYEALTEDKEVPAIDLSILPPQLQQMAMQTGMIMGQPVPMETVPMTVDQRYTVRRISPSDFLWPIEFTGSDFDNAPWVGHTGRITWAEAKARFNLSDADKAKAIGEDKTVEDRLSHDWDREKSADDGKVGFDEIFYHAHSFDTEVKSYGAIHHLVYLHGKTEPVIDEPWKGQRLDEQTGKMIGALKKPLRVLTLTYITDENIPPSDSAIGRAQVNEINKGRTQVNKQRERSISQNWFDVNRLDPTIQTAIMRGTWQHAIPVQGDGTKIIGEIPRSPMPAENYMFDRTAKQDLQEQWTIGGNQLGSGDGVETKGEANVVQANFATKVGRERAKVAAFFVGIAQVIGGLICLYEDPSSFGEGFNPAFSETLGYSILADSTVLVDSNQRLERLNNFINTYGKSGYVALEPVLKEIATLVGLDPNTVIKAPEPQQPDLPNISLRLTGGKDMMNPLLLAFMVKSGLAPDEKLIEQAKVLIQQAVTEPQPPAPPPGMPGPMGEQGMPGAPAMAPPPGTPLPQPGPTPTGQAHPNMTLMPAITKRSDEPVGS